MGLELAMSAPAGRAAEGMKDPPQAVKDNMARMAQDKLQKCYGINASKERLRRGRPFVRRRSHASAGFEIVRASASRRLRQDSRREAHGIVSA